MPKGWFDNEKWMRDTYRKHNLMTFVKLGEVLWKGFVHLRWYCRPVYMEYVVMKTIATADSVQRIQFEEIVMILLLNLFWWNYVKQEGNKMIRKDPLIPASLKDDNGMVLKTLERCAGHPNNIHSTSIERKRTFNFWKSGLLLISGWLS